MSIYVNIIMFVCVCACMGWVYKILLAVLKDEILYAIFKFKVQGITLVFNILLLSQTSFLGNCYLVIINLYMNYFAEINVNA